MLNAKLSYVTYKYDHALNSCTKSLNRLHQLKIKFEYIPELNSDKADINKLRRPFFLSVSHLTFVLVSDMLD